MPHHVRICPRDNRTHHKGMPQNINCRPGILPSTWEMPLRMTHPEEDDKESNPLPGQDYSIDT